MKYLALIFLFNLTVAFAQDAKLAQSYQELNDILSKIEKSEIDQYPQKILEFKKSFDIFIEMKKKVCKGEYSTIIFQDKVPSASEPKKELSGEEKKNCTKELKLYQRDTILKLYQFRKAFLEHSHKKLMEELDAVKEQSLKNLDTSY